MTNDDDINFLREWTTTGIRTGKFTPVAPGWVATFDDEPRPVVGWLAQKVFTYKWRKTVRRPMTLEEWRDLNGEYSTPPGEFREQRSTTASVTEVVRRIVAAVAMPDGTVVAAMDLPGLRGINWQQPEALPIAGATHDAIPSLQSAQVF